MESAEPSPNFHRQLTIVPTAVVEESVNVTGLPTHNGLLKPNFGIGGARTFILCVALSLHPKFEVYK